MSQKDEQLKGNMSQNDEQTCRYNMLLILGSLGKKGYQRNLTRDRKKGIKQASEGNGDLILGSLGTPYQIPGNLPTSNPVFPTTPYDFSPKPQFDTGFPGNPVSNGLIASYAV